MRRVVHLVKVLSEDDLTGIARDRVCTRGDAIRLAVAEQYRHAIQTHPGLDPGSLVVDITDAGRGVRMVIHTGQHVPSVLTELYTRRRKARDYVTGASDEWTAP